MPRSSYSSPAQHRSSYSSQAAAVVAAAALQKMEESITKSMSPVVEYNDNDNNSGRRTSLSPLSSRSSSHRDININSSNSSTQARRISHRPSRKSVGGVTTVDASGSSRRKSTATTNRPRRSQAHNVAQPLQAPSAFASPSASPSPSQSWKLQQPANDNTQTHAHGLPVTNTTPTCSASSSEQRVNVLVCTANLGNAPPDAESWNAWIPKDGKLVVQTKFPVRMDLPPPPPPKPGSAMAMAKAGGRPGEAHAHANAHAHAHAHAPPMPVLELNKTNNNNNNGRGTGTGTANSAHRVSAPVIRLASPHNNNNNNNNSKRPTPVRMLRKKYQSERHIRIQEPHDEVVKEILPLNNNNNNNNNTMMMTNDTTETTTDSDASYQAYLRSLQNPTPPQQQQQQQPQPQRRLSKDGSKRRIVPSRTKSLPVKSASAGLGLGLGAQKGGAGGGAAAKGGAGGGGTTSNASKPPQALKQQQQQPQQQPQPQPQQPPSKRGSVLETTKDELLALAAAAAATFAPSSHSNHSGLTAPSLDKASSHPVAPPAVVAAELFEYELGRELVDVTYPETTTTSNATSTSNATATNDHPGTGGYYDIIVIGMQEATFLTDKLGKKKSIDDEKGKGKADKENDEDEDDEGDPTDYDTDEFETDEEDNNNDDNNDVGSFASDSRSMLSSSSHYDHSKGSERSNTDKTGKRKSFMEKLVKPIKQITKATTKTTKIVNELAGSIKNHTYRRLPGMPVVSAHAQRPRDRDDDSGGPYSSNSNGGDDDDGDDGDDDHSRDEDEYSRDYDDDDDDHSHDERGPRDSASTTTTIEAAAAAALNGKKWTDTDVLHHGLETHQLPGYTRALSFQFGQMRLMIYYKSATDSATDENRNGLLKSLEVVSVNHVATGKHGLANKGGIFAEVEINRSTRLSFLTAHLEAHEGEKHYRARNESFKEILMQTSPSKYFDASQSSHFTFFMGDLNYRTNLPDVPVGSDRHIRLCHTMVSKHAFRTLNKYDELRKSLEKQTCLVGFQTAYCNFPPTFKVDRNEGYLYNVKRSPSYTDRILFRPGDKTLESALKLVLYEPIEDFVTSDHKPIRGGFSIKLNRELKWKSTAQLLLEEKDSNDDDMKMVLSMNSDDSDEDAGGNRTSTKTKRKTKKKGKTKKIKDNTKDNVLEGIVPNTTTGDIEADRESMHFLVTNIQCSIIPHKYDYIRKQEKAEMPIPKLVFLPDPRESIMKLEDIEQKPKSLLQQLTFGKRKEPAAKKTAPININIDDAEYAAAEGSINKKKYKYPCTLPAKESMRPTWKNIDDHVHFALQTHTEEGRPIDFTGAQLHISLMDAKAAGSATVIGSNSLNLAHLIIVSRDKHQKLKSRRPQKPPRSKSGRLQEMKVRENVGEVRNDGNNPTDHPPSHQQRPGPPNRAPLNRAHSTRAPLGYQIVSQPSPALRSIAAALSSPSVYRAFGTGKKGGDEASTNEPKVRAAVKEAAEYVNHINQQRSTSWQGPKHTPAPKRSLSPKKFFESMVDDLGGGDRDKTNAKNNKNKNKNNVMMEYDSASFPQTKQRKPRKKGLDEFGIKSFRLRETLIEGGLVVGHINCDIDVWWM